jgi:hypothetical protein
VFCRVWINCVLLVRFLVFLYQKSLFAALLSPAQRKVSCSCPPAFSSNRGLDTSGRIWDRRNLNYCFIVFGLHGEYTRVARLQPQHQAGGRDVGYAIKGRRKNCRSFHYAPPNFLSSLMTLAVPVAWDESSQGQALKLEPADSAQGRIYRARLYRYLWGRAHAE